MDSLREDIKTLQKKITKNIQLHQSLYQTLKEDPSQEAKTKEELPEIQKEIVELNDMQKVLIQRLRKELEATNHIGTFNFNLYRIKPGQLESKKRRRKDLRVAPKVVPVRTVAQSPPSLSPSPTPSSSSSLSDDSLDYDDVTPSQMPIPLPRPRPKLLPAAAPVFQPSAKPAKMKKPVKPLSDEEVFKDIPMYYDPPPSPEPTDEGLLKLRFMAGLRLIPKEMMSELINRKVERKRRSTATNNPHFVYNNDWEIPVWKRSRTYLSPHKVQKIDPMSRKTKSDDQVEGAKVSSLKHLRDESEGKPDRGGETKSRNSTPEAAGTVCFVCRTGGLLCTCRECNTCYHVNCAATEPLGGAATPPPVACPNCKAVKTAAAAKSPTSEDNSDTDKSTDGVEFASKCPNVAESYSKLQEYIKKHKDLDSATIYAEREGVKTVLVQKNQELYSEKEKLEERAADLSEALLLQEDSKNEMLFEQKEILGKIQRIHNFVLLFQSAKKEEGEESKVEEKVEEEAVKEEVHMEEEEKVERQKTTLFDVELEEVKEPPVVEESCTVATPASTPKGSPANLLFELNEADDQFTSESIEKESEYEEEEEEEDLDSALRPENGVELGEEAEQTEQTVEEVVLPLGEL